MSSETDSETGKMSRLLDALIHHTQEREVAWEQVESATGRAYTTSLASGSIMLSNTAFSSLELRILDQAGEDVFEYRVGRTSLRSPLVDADELDMRLTRLFETIEGQFSRHSDVVDGLLNELGA